MTFANLLAQFLRGHAIRVYAVALIVVDVAIVAILVRTGFGVGPIAVVCVLAAIAIVADRDTIRLSPTIEASTASLPFIFAGVALGPLAAVIVGVAGLLSELFRRDVEQPYLRWAVWSGARALIAAGSGLAAFALGGTTTHSLGILAGAVLAATVVEAIGDLIFAPIPSVLRGTGSWKGLTRALVPLQLSSIPLHVPVIAVLAYAYRMISPWSLALFLIPAFAAQRLFLLYRQQRETAEELADVNGRLEKANLSFATALVATLDARDRYTAGHSAAVAVYARDIAERMGLDEEEQRKAHLCGFVHDIGKIGLPAGLLEKPGAMTLEERRLMEQHSEIGERILGKVDDYAEIAAVVRHHHERVDGQGYPDRLAGDEIPILSRIIAVADAYNAMTSDRPYRDAMPSRVARLRLAQAVESQFDTSVVAAFEAILTGATESYRMGSRPDFVLESQSPYSESLSGVA